MEYTTVVRYRGPVPYASHMASIQCRKGETFPRTHTHDSVAAVRRCYYASTIPAEDVIDIKPTTDTNPWAAVRELEKATPEGRYAIVEQDGVTRFYVVQKGKEGSAWHGRTFVKIQASDDLHSIKTPSRLTAVLSAIAADPKAAMLRYGLELGRCGHCGRTLTDEESRARGIGPVCAGKQGW